MGQLVGNDPQTVAANGFVDHLLFHPGFVSVRQWFVCAKVTSLIILMRYQRVTDKADGPLSDAPKGGGES
jgi:hypothetical protein